MKPYQEKYANILASLGQLKIDMMLPYTPQQGTPEGLLII